MGINPSLLSSKVFSFLFILFCADGCCEASVREVFKAPHRGLGMQINACWVKSKLGQKHIHSCQSFRGLRMCFHLVLCHTELTAGSSVSLGPGLLGPSVCGQVHWSHRVLLCLAQVSSSLLSVSNHFVQVSHFFEYSFLFSQF